MHGALIVTLRLLVPHAEALESAAALSQFPDSAAAKHNNMCWLRERLKKTGSLNKVARL